MIDIDGRILDTKYENSDYSEGDIVNGWCVMGRSIRSVPGRAIYSLSRCVEGICITIRAEIVDGKVVVETSVDPKGRA